MTAAGVQKLKQSTFLWADKAQSVIYDVDPLQNDWLHFTSEL